MSGLCMHAWASARSKKGPLGPGDSVHAFMAEQGSSTNAWLMGALASAVAGVALLAASRTRRTETTVAV